MKKLVYLLVMFAFATSMAFAAMPAGTPGGGLPKAAQEFMNTMYPGVQCVYLKQEFDGFDVRLANGVKIEFKNDGTWEQISNYAGLPETLLPANIAAVVKQSQPQAMIVKIEKEWFGEYKVKMNNRMKMRFDKDGKLLYQKYDD